MKRSLQFTIFVYATITLIVIVLLFPFFVAISTALKDLDQVYADPPQWLPAAYELTDRSFDELEQAGVPTALLSDLQPLKGETLKNPGKFIDAVTQSIGEEAAQQYEAEFLDSAWKLSPAWGNFVQIWERYPLANYFLNSLFVASGATLLTTLLCIPAAYAFARLRFVGRRPLLFFLLVVQMFSPIIVVIALYKIVVALHLADTLTSLIIVNAVFTLAFATWMMNGYFSTIPKEIEEAALIDGCSRFQTITLITLPIAMPGVVTVIIYTFITAWNEFMFALTFISSTEKRPLTLGLYNFVGRWAIEWQSLMAAALVAIIPVIILFMLIEKQLVQGLAGGAVKG